MCGCEGGRMKGREGGREGGVHAHNIYASGVQ